jgi:hypothetical protein
MKFMRYCLLLVLYAFSLDSYAGCTFGSRAPDPDPDKVIWVRELIICSVDSYDLEKYQFYYKSKTDVLNISYNNGWRSDGTRKYYESTSKSKYPDHQRNFVDLEYKLNLSDKSRGYLKVGSAEIANSSRALTNKDNGHHGEVNYNLASLNLSPANKRNFQAGRVEFCKETTGLDGWIPSSKYGTFQPNSDIRSDKLNAAGKDKVSTSCKFIKIPFGGSASMKIDDVEVTKEMIDTNGSFLIEWPLPADNEDLPTLYRSYNNASWEQVKPNILPFHGRRGIVKESDLKQGVYRYKLKRCLASICTDSEIKKIKVEPTPSAPIIQYKKRGAAGYNVSTPLSRYLKSSKFFGPWYSVDFSDNSTNPRYVFSYAKKAHNDVIFSEYISFDVDSDSTINRVDEKFILNGFDYKFKIKACNSSCSSETEFLHSTNINPAPDAQNVFEAVFKPSDQAFVLPINSIADTATDAYTQLPPGSNSEAYLSDTGSYKLQLSSMNATHFAIHEYRQVRGSEILESSELKWIPVAIDPMVMIPVTEYTQTTVDTVSPILGDENGDRIYSRVNKTLSEETVVSTTFNQSQSGEYFYSVMACNRIGDDADATDDNCVSLPQVTVTVDLQISQPSAAIFKVNEGKLGFIFEINAAPVTYFQIFDANNQSIGRFDNNDAGLAAAVLALKNAEAGYTLVACNASSCTTPIQLTLPPKTPSYVSISGSSTAGFGHSINWPTTAGANSYTLEIEVVNPQEHSDVWLPKYTVNTTETSYVFPKDNKTFGLHRYRVLAENDAGQSAYTSLIGYMVELDPTVYIRKQLYYAYEDIDGGIQVGDEIVKSPGEEPKDIPQAGLYDRDKAAFRYLDLLYSKQVSAENIEIRGEADLSIGSVITNAAGELIYGDAERQKAKIAEQFIRSELAGEYANNSNVQQLLLDVYFDRAVAEFYLANAWRDRARVLRFTDQAGSNFEDEIAYTVNATKTYENALFGDDIANENLPGYANLLDYSNTSYRAILLRHAKGRGQISPRYWQGDAAFKVVEDDQRNDVLTSGYKDLTLIYELMAAVLESKVEEAKLRVIAGESNSILLDVNEAALLALKEKVNAFHNSLLDENNGLFKDELSKIINDTDWSGFAAAKARYISADAKAQTAISWLNGDSNILGLPNDMMVFNYDENTDASSYDVYMSDINTSGSAYNQVITNFSEAANSYDTFRSNNDAASSYAINHVAGWVTQLKDLIGYDCSVECAETVSGWEVSQISLQAKAIIEAQNNAEIAEEQLEGLYKKIDSKRILLEKFVATGNKTRQVMLDYGHMQANITKRIVKLKVDAARKAARRRSRMSIGNMVSAGMSGFFSTGKNAWGAALSIGAAVSAKQEEWKIAKIGINASKNIGALTALSSELALEQQVKIHKLTSDSQEAALIEQIEAMWVDANLLAMNIEQVALRVEVEADKLTLLMNKAQYAVDKIASSSETLINRYFADPVHARRVTYAMDAAYLGFEAAQIQLFLTANALEYKLGLNLIDNAGFDKNEIFKARTHDDLINFKDDMVAYEQNNLGLSGQETYARLSIKDEIFGFKRRLVNTLVENPWGDDTWEWIEAEEFDHPDPAKTEKLKADEAFTETLVYALKQFDDFIPSEEFPTYNDWVADKSLYFSKTNTKTYLTVRFDTVRSFDDLNHGSIFRGPSFSGNSGELCYKDLGTYGDKIHKVAVLTTVSTNISGRESVEIGLGYDGYSYFRGPEAPNLSETQSEDYPVPDIIEYQRLAAQYKAGLNTPYDTSDDISQGDLDALKDRIKLLGRQSDVQSFDTRFWSYNHATNRLKSTKDKRFTNSSRIVDYSILSNNLESELRGYWFDGLKERSVASSKWVIEIPIFVGESDRKRNPLIALNYLKDIELIFHHEFLDRSNTYDDMCSSP